MIQALVNSPAAWSDRAALACPLEAVGWTAVGQADRFAAALEHLDLRAGSRLLDFGCGTGALTSWIPGDVNYLGYDWAPGMVERACGDHPDRQFTARYPRGQFDEVAAIGPFNLADQWTKQDTFRTLRHLWDTTGCATLVVSLYAGEDSRCLAYTEAEIKQVGRDLGHGALVRRHRSNDLLLVASR